MSCERRRSQAGFTLLEVLLALAVFALLSAAVTKQSRSSLHTLDRVHSTPQAMQLAANTIERAQLLSPWPALGNTIEELELGDRRWRIETAIASTKRADMRRITVAVSSANLAAAGAADWSLQSQLAGYLGQY